MLQIISPLSTTTTPRWGFISHVFFFVCFCFSFNFGLIVMRTFSLKTVCIVILLFLVQQCIGQCVHPSPKCCFHFRFSFHIIFKWPIVCNAITVLFDSFSAIKSACAYKNTMVNYKCVFLCSIIIIMELRIKWSNVL